MAASIQVVKFVNGDDADTPTGPQVAEGSTLTFTYVVTDPGDVAVQNVVLTDNQLGLITSFTGDTNGDGNLDPGETWTYSATAPALAGQQTNVATVTGAEVGTGTPVTDENPANYFGDAPAINIVKFVNSQDADSPTGPHVVVGDNVFFAYFVTNTGNVPLANVVVTDDNGTPLDPADDFNPTFVAGGDTNGNGLLDLTETWIYIAPPPPPSPASRPTSAPSPPRTPTPARRSATPTRPTTSATPRSTWPSPRTTA
jgi:hypothetical protein